MSNKTQLQANNTQLAALIETLQGKAAGGGSGGASVETCTVKISLDADARMDEWAYSFLSDDGTISTVYEAPSYGESPTNTVFRLEKVICGSYFRVSFNGPSIGVSLDNVENVDGFSNTNTHNMKAPTVGGSTGTVTVIGDD